MKMKLAGTFVCADAFHAQWPRSVAALARLCEGPIAPPDNRYQLARDDIEATRERPAINEIERALRKLWAFDERFFGEAIGGGEAEFRWSVYCAAYLFDDALLASDLLDVFCPLLGAFAVEAFGESFARKVYSTFQDDVAEVIWERQELKGPRRETEFFDWHGQLNAFPDAVRADLLGRAGLPLLDHPSLPPRDVMQVFCRGVHDPTTVTDDYRRDLASFYADQGYADVSAELLALEERAPPDE